jgi:1,4-dihydroxy-2-naphthoyl-CoA synthase
MGKWRVGSFANGFGGGYQMVEVGQIKEYKELGVRSRGA